MLVHVVPLFLRELHRQSTLIVIRAFHFRAPKSVKAYLISCTAVDPIFSGARLVHKKALFVGKNAEITALVRGRAVERIGNWALTILVQIIIRESQYFLGKNTDSYSEGVQRYLKNVSIKSLSELR